MTAIEMVKVPLFTGQRSSAVLLGGSLLKGRNHSAFYRTLTMVKVGKF